VTWPVTPRLLDDGRFLLTTSIGLPQKAFNIRRNPKVSMLFSEPMGSGVAEPGAVLIQGDATAEDRIITDVSSDKELAALLETLVIRQPAGALWSSRLGRRMWWSYYIRILTYVTPRRAGCLRRFRPHSTSSRVRPTCCATATTKRRGTSTPSKSRVASRVARADGYFRARISTLRRNWCSFNSSQTHARQAKSTSTSEDCSAQRSIGLPSKRFSVGVARDVSLGASDRHPSYWRLPVAG
jgi:hypothetical protein